MIDDSGDPVEQLKPSQVTAPATRLSAAGVGTVRERIPRFGTREQFVRTRDLVVIHTTEAIPSSRTDASAQELHRGDLVRSRRAIGGVFAPGECVVDGSGVALGIRTGDFALKADCVMEQRGPTPR